ncbi:RlmE family RNA methyltransferase [Candidatus Peregrinibacteria bacterium]|nr:MAG: RlmE family RNA methyltransferase [Candidatus Peregrinibacteria bacterium]
MGKVYQPNDKYAQRAQQDGFRARSVYKLQEIQERYGIIKPGQKILDLGAAPGSFMQLIGQLVGEKGLVIGVDLQLIKPFKAPNMHTYQADINDETVYDRIATEHGVERFDVITSDLAPATTGIKSVDSGRSFELNAQVLNVADMRLKKGGYVILKSFPGAEQDQLMQRLKNDYRTLRMLVPKAVRQTSREVYLIGMGKL